MRRILAVAILIVLIGSASLIRLTLLDPDLNLYPEVAKAIIQLMVVTLVGAAFSMLVFEHQHKRALRDKTVEYRQSLLLSVLAKALAAYSQAKKARRLLRARAIVHRDGSEFLLADGYDLHMELVNDAQLEFENLVRDVETSEGAFSHPSEIVARLCRMEEHLNKLVSEYEKERPLFGDPQAARPLRNHEELYDFLLPAEESRFRPEVSRPYQEVQEMIRADLLHPQVPRARTESKAKDATT